MGDLIVASRVEPVAADQPGAAQHPLVWNGKLYTPSFAEPISIATHPGLTVVVPMVVAGDAPVALVELRRGSVTVKSVALPAGAALADGRLMLVGRVPIDDVPAGSYELSVTVTQGGQAVGTDGAGHPDE